MSQGQTLKRVGLRGDRLRMLREAKGLDQLTAAQAIGISNSHLSRLEVGNVGSVSVDVFGKIVAYYDTSLAFLTGLSDDVSGRDLGESGLAQDEVEALHVYSEIQDPTIRAAALATLRQFLGLDRGR